MLNEEEYFELEEIFKCMASAPRLKILSRLQESEANVNELCAVAGLSQSATSHQLKELKLRKIIKARKDGLNIYYSLADGHILEIIRMGTEHIRGEHCEQ